MSPYKIVIVLFGRKHTGKGTVAAYLAENYGAQIKSFAEPLKRITMGAFSFTHEQMYTEEGKNTIDPRYGKTPRWFLERLGTEGVQPVLGRDFWAKRVYAEIASDPHPLWVVDDGRFYHEFAGSGGLLFLAVRLTDTNKEPITPTTHASDRVDELAATLFDAQVTWARDGEGDQRARILSAFTPVWEGLLKQRTALRETIGYMERQRALKGDAP